MSSSSARAVAGGVGSGHSHIARTAASTTKPTSPAVTCNQRDERPRAPPPSAGVSGLSMVMTQQGGKDEYSVRTAPRDRPGSSPDRIDARRPFSLFGYGQARSALALPAGSCGYVLPARP